MVSRFEVCGPTAKMPSMYLELSLMVIASLRGSTTAALVRSIRFQYPISREPALLV